MARASSSRKGRRRRPTPAAPRAAAAGSDAPTATATSPSQTQTLLRPRREAPRPTVVGAPRRRSRLTRLLRPPFVMDIIAELQKVVWPSRTETRNLTVVVLIVAIAVGVVLGVVDWGFNRILENVLLP